MAITAVSFLICIIYPPKINSLICHYYITLSVFCQYCNNKPSNFRKNAELNSADIIICRSSIRRDILRNRAVPRAFQARGDGCNNQTAPPLLPPPPKQSSEFCAPADRQAPLQPPCLRALTPLLRASPLSFRSPLSW